MIIAIATTNNIVSNHFGGSDFFHIYDVQNNQATLKTTIKNDGRPHSQLPALLAINNVKTLLVGGVCNGSFLRLKDANITVISGVTTTLDEAIKSYVSGEIKPQGDDYTHHKQFHTHKCSN